MDLLMSALHYSGKDPSFAQAGFYCLAGGVLLGIPAILTGLFDLLRIPKEDKKAFALALYHGFLNGSVILIFAVLAYKEWTAWPAINSTMGGIIFKGILVLALFGGNYLGGKLIYNHHIGLDKKTLSNEYHSAKV